MTDTPGMSLPIELLHTFIRHWFTTTLPMFHPQKVSAQPTARKSNSPTIHDVMPPAKIPMQQLQETSHAAKEKERDKAYNNKTKSGQGESLWTCYTAAQ
jgi:hypothetical protein